MLKKILGILNWVSWQFHAILPHAQLGKFMKTDISSSPHGARVSGVVEETPGRLEYEVALYKEAPAARLSNTTQMGNSELPVDQAVPIGTKLQLRAKINPDSAWKYVKLMEVTVSPDPDEPHMTGSVALVKDGWVETFEFILMKKKIFSFWKWYKPFYWLGK